MPDDVLLQLSILGPAFLAGALVLSTHVPLGQEVLRRGIIFLDLAIAQIAAFGLIVASFFGLETHEGHTSQQLLAQAVAIGAAIAGASIMYRFHNAPARIQEALIGILFMLAATGCILLLAKDPHGGERLKEILVGQILWVEYMDLSMTALLYLPLLGLIFFAREKLQGYIFYPIFAVAITLSTQLVGVYLVFASLIVPALASANAKKPLWVGYGIGLAGYAIGLALSALFDLPSGPMVAWCLVSVALLYYGYRRVAVR